MKEALGAQNLLQIYNVYDKLKSTNPPPSTSTSQSTFTSASGPSATNLESEKLKSQGNEAMKAKDYPLAITHYTSALALSPTNAIYLSNRAAAYSAQQDYKSAAQDAELATAADPNYAKGWSRLGAARYALGDYKASVDAYAKAMEVEGGGSDLSRKGYETAKKKLEESEKDTAAEAPEPEVDDAPSTARGTGGPGAGAGTGTGGGMPDLSALAGMFGGGGGGAGGGGGMPDLGGLMNNPMFAQMAQNVMQNPEALQGLMQNPQVRGMAERMGLGGGAGGRGGQESGAGTSGGAGRGAGGGGMPDLAAMMQDPAMQEM